MASKSTQAISRKKSKPTTARSNSEASGHVTRSMARNQPTTFVVLPSKSGEPIITLANLADQHASQSEDQCASRSEGKHASRSEEKETPNKSREQSFSPATNDETSTASYDRSPNDDEDHTYGMSVDYSSQPIPMQVMVTDASTIEEQIANLMGAAEKLTKTVEEKDTQIAELYSRLESQEEEKKHKVGESSKNNDEDDDGLLGSMSFQQLQDIITNSIRAQYGGPSHDSLTYSKPYTKRINGLRMPLLPELSLSRLKPSRQLPPSGQPPAASPPQFGPPSPPLPPRPSPRASNPPEEEKSRRKPPIDTSPELRHPATIGRDSWLIL
ncbi:hypothetical protein ACLB2K_037916 [Fragaria x ananassa]